MVPSMMLTTGTGLLLPVVTRHRPRRERVLVVLPGRVVGDLPSREGLAGEHPSCPVDDRRLAVTHALLRCEAAHIVQEPRHVANVGHGALVVALRILLHAYLRCSSIL